ncbi:hypothetical protein [Caulobacter sp. NIBR1757]|uniref:hypothetical protein n=1 Tax=Caulobacter sp. NIBR1757 TaxID=3016000 RepID=UPI0022F07C0A|nr:hypothetical protein [Caulobacter sp. NIBR1757]WGM41053.1 hypothetical protein AMEJIAPC_04001 [Caulobacter sp. NIBR1757]
MSGPLKITDHRRPIVEPGGPVWPWSQGGTDLDIGQSAINSSISFREQTVEVGPEKKQRRQRIKRSPAYQATSRPGLLNGLIPPVVGLLAVFHASPHIGDFIGLTDLLFSLAGSLPFGELLAPAAQAWSFEPFWVWAAALGLRVMAMNAAKKSVIGALTLAVAAFLLEAGAWVVLGSNREGQGPLATLLLVEGALLLVPLVLLWLLDRQRRRQEV